MRKFFASLKSVVAATLVGAMTLAVSCSYDDSAINKRVDKVEKDLAALTERVKALEDNLQQEVPTLEDLLAGKIVIVNVTTDADGNTILELSNGKKITVLGPCGYEPCDHECTPCDCDNLKYRVTDGVLEVSADGENWVAINGVTAEQVVADVVINEDGTVTITLADGQEFTVVKAELIECEAALTGVYVEYGKSKDVAFCVNDAVVDINIMNQPLGWSATVEEATEAPEAGDDEAMALAAGGKNYVLKVNAPSASFKEAAKEGVVSVHFNTAAGACKVLSVNVNVAELTFDIDKDGNITITNSLVERKGNPMIGYHEGFANFFLGAVYKSDYEFYNGDLQEILYAGDPISFQQHDGLMFFNQAYEPGVCEKEVATFTVEELLNEFKSCGMSDVVFEYGNEYVIYLAKTTSRGDQDLNNVITFDYAALKVAAEKVEGSETWNGADYKFTILGYDYAIIGYVQQEMVDIYIQEGLCSDLDAFYDIYIASAENYGYPMIGTPIELGYEPWNEQLITAAELTTLYEAITPNTEYRLYALCFNYEDMMMGKEFTHEDLYDFGTFTTTDLKAGDFEVVSEVELVSWESNTVKANITLSDDVKLSCYEIFYEATADQEARIEEMMAYAYFEEKPVINIYQYVGDKTEIYVGIIGVNDNGEYAYQEVKLSQNGGEEQEPVLEVIEMNPVSRAKYDGRYYLQLWSEDGKYCAVYYLYGIVDANKGYIPAGEYTVGTDYPGIYAYGYSQLYDYEASAYTHNFDEGGVMSVSEVNGAYHIEFTGGLTAKSDSSAATMEFVFDGAIENLILPSEYVEPTVLEFTPVRADYDLKLVGNNDSEYAYWLYDANNNYIEIICHFNKNTGWDALYEGALVINGERFEASDIATQMPNDTNCASGEKYFAIGKVKFANDTVYSYTGILPAVEVNYEGDGADYVPGADNGGNETSGPDLTGYTELTDVQVAYKSEGGTVKFTASNPVSLALDIYPFYYAYGQDFQGTVGTANIEQLTVEGFSATSGTVDCLRQADGSYLVMIDATFQTVGAQKFYFYVTL